MKVSKKTRARRKMILALDADARQQVFERDSFRCVRCGKSNGIQWAHIFSRRHKTLRWEPDNAVTFCAGCHMWWHQYPVLAIDWLRKNYRERYEHILVIYNAGGKADIKGAYEKLGRIGTTDDGIPAIKLAISPDYGLEPF